MADETEIRRALAILVPTGVFEIRAPKARPNGSRLGTASGYFDNYEAAIKPVISLSGQAPGVYITLNPVNPALKSRAANRINPRAENTTTDAEIITRYWAPLDFDPVRPAGISSSNKEHDDALERAYQCRARLTEEGWPLPVYADSGNGAHLLYRIDLPNDEASKNLIASLLKTLASRFNDDRVILDTGVYNAARIMKLYGTQACKGDPLPDRPHRIARILETPETPSPVAVELLQALLPADRPTLSASRSAAVPSATTKGDFFAQVNTRAMQSLSAWVPTLFPAATPYHDGYRVSSKALNRDLEEDLSIVSAGIKDFGLADQGDANSGKRTPIDLVIEHGHHPDAPTAALWLCHTLCLPPESLGWKSAHSSSTAGTKNATCAHARVEINNNPSHPSYSSQSMGYPFTLEDEPFIFITINDLAFDYEKGELPEESIAAEHIAQELEGKLAFCNKARIWHAFTGTHWQPVKTKPVEDLFTRILYRAAPQGFSASYLRAIISLLGSGLLPLKKPQNAKDGLIPFENGLLDPVTRVLSPVTADNALTWCLPYCYDPGAQCTTIQRWLFNAVDQDEETLQFLRAWLAAVLVGRPDVQKFLHLLGPGGSGKGTFIRLAAELIGSRNLMTTDFRTLETSRFETSGLYQKRLVAITDSGNYRGGIDVFKALTGQDPIRLEHKHKDPGTFTFTGMVIIASNEGMMTRDFTSGLERRRLTVEFNKVASAAARSHWDALGGEAAVLHKEIPGLVNWVLALSREMVTRALMNPPQRSLEANMNAFRFGNPIADWLLENTVKDGDGSAKVGDKQVQPGGGLLNYKQWLYPNYLDWCRRNARNDTVSLTRFSRLILDVGRTLEMPLKKERGRTGVFIKGLRLRQPQDAIAFPISEGVSEVEATH